MFKHKSQREIKKDKQMEPVISIKKRNQINHKVLYSIEPEVMPKAATEQKRDRQPEVSKKQQQFIHKEDTAESHRMVLLPFKEPIGTSQA